jgi:biotin carboxyl carrier protein
MKLFAEIDGQTITFIERNNDERYSLILGDSAAEYDFVQLDENRYSLIWENRSYLLHFSRKDGNIFVTHEGQQYAVKIETEREKRIRDLTSVKESDQRDMILKAPIPGLVSKIDIAVDQEVNKGEPLLILEAMKMENIIKAPCSCRVSEILVKTGQNVEQDMPLVKLKSNI